MGHPDRAAGSPCVNGGLTSASLFSICTYTTFPNIEITMTHEPSFRNKTKHFTCLLPIALLALAACTGKQDVGETQPAGGGEPEKTIRVAFVTNMIADFWNIAKAGCRDAEKDLHVKVEVKMPSQGTVEKQKQIVEDLISSGINGIAISPLDADNQVAWLDEIASKVPLITHDSDCPGSKRLCYIGMDNYKAGRMCGELVKDAIPGGGEVMLFIGRLEQDNSKYRRQGVIDELMGRPVPENLANLAYDPEGQPVVGEKFTVLDTLTDQGKHEVAKQKAADAINAYPQMKAMVGLFEYNPPACYQALKQAGKLGAIELIGFDENNVTLQGIKDGTIKGTVVQNPYEYGYQSVQILKDILEGNEPRTYIDIPPRKITEENVDDFWADLKAKKEG
jgi:ribose transport system substrate-binding protein